MISGDDDDDDDKVRWLWGGGSVFTEEKKHSIWER